MIRRKRCRCRSSLSLRAHGVDTLIDVEVAVRPQYWPVSIHLRNVSTRSGAHRRPGGMNPESTASRIDSASAFTATKSSSTSPRGAMWSMSSGVKNVLIIYHVGLSSSRILFASLDYVLGLPVASPLRRSEWDAGPVFLRGSRVVV
jgi:hypothetical protein